MELKSVTIKKMKRIILVHGWSGSPAKDWFPWLSKELKEKGYEVLIPEMPDTDHPVIEQWVGHLAKTVGEPAKDTYFIGHSIGCQTILRYLDARRFAPMEQVGGAIFVAGWFNLENMESDEERAIASPWIEKPINPMKVKTVLPKSILIISDNDPYDAFEENKKKFKELGSEIVTLHNANHMTGEDGYIEFPRLLSEVEKLVG